MTPRIDVNLIGTCYNAECDGQYTFNDGVTFYNYVASGLRLNHNDAAKTGCIGVYYSTSLNHPFLEDLFCTDPNTYAVCQCSP